MMLKIVTAAVCLAHASFAAPVVGAASHEEHGVNRTTTVQKNADYASLQMLNTHVHTKREKQTFGPAIDYLKKVFGSGEGGNCNCPLGRPTKREEQTFGPAFDLMKQILGSSGVLSNTCDCAESGANGGINSGDLFGSIFGQGGSSDGNSGSVGGSPDGAGPIGDIFSGFTGEGGQNPDNEGGSGAMVTDGPGGIDGPFIGIGNNNGQGTPSVGPDSTYTGTIEGLICGDRNDNSFGSGHGFRGGPDQQATHTSFYSYSYEVTEDGKLTYTFNVDRKHCDYKTDGTLLTRQGIEELVNQCAGS
ncbi:hypothetical protein QQS21_009709 [Conoideocrella luteorostrata]|uniref:Uncharacterized protein n=1 Tax=Conoideocrella luteorostrata TaxID=1105319 RepID=A0AAJ0FQ51_9HYPO|nr:hypothetical protein QQS21_009709 [Conoideocrella luteorostrata]